MTKDTMPDFDLDALLAREKTAEVPSQALMARVLADAADIGARYTPPAPQAPQVPRKRWAFLAPVFGAPGLIALGMCALFGFGVGLGNAESLVQIPGMEQVIALIDGNVVPNNPYYTLELLMTES